jgi:hypothetical protein
LAGLEDAPHPGRPPKLDQVKKKKWFQWQKP